MMPFEIASTTTMEAILQAYRSVKVGLFTDGLAAWDADVERETLPLPALGLRE